MTKQPDIANTEGVVKIIDPNLITEESEMAKYGITCNMVKNYQYGKFRYSSFQDALSQAKRDPKKGRS